MTDRLPAPDRSKFPALDAGPYVHVHPAGELLGRIYFTGGEYGVGWSQFRHYGPTSSRFDHHPTRRTSHPEHGIYYAAPKVTDVHGRAVTALQTCLVEVFRDTGVVDTATNNPYFVLFRPRRPMNLVDLVDSNWITLAGGNALIYAGARSRARAWARAIHAQYTDIDGLFYGCSNLPRGRSIALFERAKGAIPPRPEVNLPLSHPGLWPYVEAACDDLGLDLI